MEDVKYFAVREDEYWSKLELTDEYSQRALNLLSPQKGEFILDNGCGSGRFSLAIIERGGEVIALDVSQFMAKVVKKKGVEAVVADSQRLPFRNLVFDKTFCVHNLWYVPLYDKAVSEMLRTTKLKGKMIFDQISEKQNTFSNPFLRRLLWRLRPTGGMAHFYQTPEQFLKPLKDHKSIFFHVPRPPLSYMIFGLIFPFLHVLSRRWKQTLIEGFNPNAHRWLVICEKSGAS